MSPERVIGIIAGVLLIILLVIIILIFGDKALW